MSPSITVALVTGAARGLGLTIARQLLDEGYAVVMGDRDAELLAESVRGLGSESGRNVVAQVVDVCDRDSISELAAMIDAQFGKLDLLVNNAGVISRGPAENFDFDSWQHQLDVSLGGSLRCSQEAFSLLRQAEAPSIVNMASVGSTFGLPGRVAYSSAKTAVLGLTRTLAAEWGPIGIRVNAIAPGYMETRMTHSGLSSGALDRDRILQRTPLRRLGSPEDVGNAVSFLGSPKARFITGTCLRVDGGITIDGTFHDPELEEDK